MGKVAHIMHAKTKHHVISIVNETRRYFGDDGHHFFFFKLLDHKAFYQKALISVEDISELTSTTEFVSIVRSYDKVIMHSFLIKKYWARIFLLPSSLKKKIVWVCWGAGINYTGGIKGYLLNALRKKMYGSLGCVVTLMSPDYRILSEKFGLQNVMVLPYYSSNYDFTNNERIKEGKPYRGLKNTTVKIKVGNSASPTNKHKYTLQLLSKYKSEDVEILIPLAYGPSSNRKEVEMNAKLVFADKVHILRDMLPKAEYIELLSDNTDMLFYGAQSQTGLFNLYFAAFFGKKIFVAGSNYQWLSDMGLTVFDVADTAHLSFEEFRKPLSEQQIQSNKSQLIKHLDVNVIVPKWQELFRK